MDWTGAGSPVTDVRIDDPFWSRMREIARVQGIPYQWEALNDRLADTEPSYCMRNFRIAAGQETGEHAGRVFQDSDVAKWIEAAAFSLKWHPDAKLEATVDGAIDTIVLAQRPDGYLNTYYILTGLDKRWTNLKDNHELYCAGHMLEAAVAYYEATGKRALLDAMLRFVDHIDSVMGPEPGKLKGYPGHPVIEMALMRLYALTGEEKHLRLAEYFVNQRGKSPLFFEEETRRNGNPFWWKEGPHGYRYYQADRPVREQMDAEGHAVRAMYLYAGMADVARETRDDSLRAACEALWRSTVHRRMYITGGIGSSEYGEAFTFDYDLPNDTVYAETCASIGLVFFARRMLSLSANGEYADVMERALYNGVISGMQLDGQRFFYVNPLEVQPEASAKDGHKQHVKVERQKWFGCACCPPNLIRMLTSLGEYAFTSAGNTLFAHLYLGAEAKVQVSGTPVTVRTETEYPWQGSVGMRLSLGAPKAFTLALRIPGWCRKHTIAVNGKPIDARIERGYAYLERSWQDGDAIQLTLDMPVDVNRANPRIREDIGKVAITRGPLVYCLEEADNGPNLHLVHTGQLPDFRVAHEPRTLGGITALYATATRDRTQDWSPDTLYDATRGITQEVCDLKWIPYYAWANRAPGEMMVWIRK